MLLNARPPGERKYRVSHDVAPPSMFEADSGLVPMEIAKTTNKLLSTRAFQICGTVSDGNADGLTANVRLLREPMAIGRRNAPADHPPPNGVHGGWDGYCALRKCNVGGFVKGALSTTTVKRRTGVGDHN